MLHFQLFGEQTHILHTASTNKRNEINETKQNETIVYNLCVLSCADCTFIFLCYFQLFHFTGGSSSCYTTGSCKINIAALLCCIYNIHMCVCGELIVRHFTRVSGILNFHSHLFFCCFTACRHTYVQNSTVVFLKEFLKLRGKKKNGNNICFSPFFRSFFHYVAIFHHAR